MPPTDALIDAALRTIWPVEDQYARDPVAWVHDVLGEHPWSKQREILELVRDHPRTAVRSCHGVGKTTVASWIVLWFLLNHKNSRVIATAPTWNQVRDQLFRSIRESVDRAHRHDRLTHIPVASQTMLELGPQWFATGLSTDRPERFQGHHADHLLLVVDEASGVDDGIFEAAEGFLTGEGAKVLLIGNPTRIGTQFYRAFTAEKSTWKNVAISAFDTPNLTGEVVPERVRKALPRADWPAEMAAKWGEHTPPYEVRVLGKFSRTSDRNVISLGDVEDAQGALRHSSIPRPDALQDRHIVAIDVARHGGDETVIAVRSGRIGSDESRVRIVHTHIGRDLTVAHAKALEIARDLPRQTTSIVVDDPGLGGGVTDFLRATDEYPVVPFNGGEKAHRPDAYPNRRSELWFQFAAHLSTVALDADEQLTADLTAPEYGYDDRTRRVVEKKDVTRKRLGRSPDRADAVCLCFAMPLERAGTAVEDVSARRAPRTEALSAGVLDWEL